jgi:FdrA protein
MPKNAKLATTLKAAAELALGETFQAPSLAKTGKGRGRAIAGLFAGGTLCAEAQVIARDARIACASNVAIPGVADLAPGFEGHTFIDLGDDEYTAGRPHPMIEPAVRDKPMADALADPNIAVVLIDCVLGFGGHMDPAGHIATFLSKHSAGTKLVIASVTGTDGDPQNLSRQRAALDRAGVLVAPSNADAVRLALGFVGAKL